MPPESILVREYLWGGVLHIEAFGLFFIVSRVGIRVVFI